MNHSVCLAWLLIAWLGTGCQGPLVLVEVDEYGHSGWGNRSVTWDWAPPPLASVRAPEGEAGRLQAQLSELVAEALAARGLIRSGDRPDVYVSYRLEVTRVVLVRIETGPAQRITGSLMRGHYEVHPSVRNERQFEESVLVVGITSAETGRVVWLAKLQHRFRHRFEPHLESTVARVFDRFPSAPSLMATADVAADP